jgi:hypothetical protein
MMGVSQSSYTAAIVYRLEVISPDPVPCKGSEMGDIKTQYKRQ